MLSKQLIYSVFAALETVGSKSLERLA